MRAIPIKMRTQLAEDPDMGRCIWDLLGMSDECDGRIEFEHAIMYAGRQLNEPWAIVGACTYHHRGPGLNKDLNRFMALRKANLDEVVVKYPKTDWRQIWSYLSKRFIELSIAG